MWVCISHYFEKSTRKTGHKLSNMIAYKVDGDGEGGHIQ